MSLVDINDQGTPVEVDRAKILAALNLHPKDPRTQALLLVCERYDLDPLLKHMVLIEGNPYISRDGLLHVAHRSGQLDGIVVEEESEASHEWRARVSVWRKDMSRPFTFRGRYPKQVKGKDGKLGPARYGPEMAVKCAESHALRRAFDVTGMGIADEIQGGAGDWVDAVEVTDADRSNADQLQRINELSAGLDDAGKAAARQWVDDHGIKMTQMSAAQADAIIGMLSALVEGTIPPPSTGAASGADGGVEVESPSAPPPSPASGVVGGKPRSAALNKRFLKAAVDGIEIPDYLAPAEYDVYRKSLLCELAFNEGFRVTQYGEIGDELAERLIDLLDQGAGRLPEVQSEADETEAGY